MDFSNLSYDELKAARDDIDGLMEQRRIAALEDFKGDCNIDEHGSERLGRQDERHCQVP